MKSKRPTNLTTILPPSTFVHTDYRADVRNLKSAGYDDAGTSIVLAAAVPLPTSQAEDKRVAIRASDVHE